jgi:hypothetical protein
VDDRESRASLPREPRHSVKEARNTPRAIEK